MIFYRFALRFLATLVVPRAIRKGWVAEWDSEVWYFADSLAVRGWERQRELVGFCRGAIDDALYLREARRSVRTRAAGSAVACAGWAGVAALVAMGVACGLPHVRTAILSPVYRGNEAVAISPYDSRNDTLSVATFRAWKRRPQHLFRDFAFYAPANLVWEGRGLRVARASGNLLSMLGVPVQHGLAEDGRAALVLTASAFRERFGEDAGVLGRTLSVDGESVRVVGVVPDEAAPDGLKLDAWLLLPAAAVEALPGTTPVHLLARRAASHAMTLPSWTMMVRGSEKSAETETDYDCVVVPPVRADVWKLFLFAMFLGLLALPATTSLSLGEYAARPANLPWTSTLRRWLFLAVKIGCVLPLVYFVSLSAAYAVRFQNPETSQYVHLVTAFSLTLFLLRWALRDQRRRCPVCLGRLTCPARVGEPSRNFLAWNGTELICEGGHGFLHVPEMATSWFGTQRWLHLDPSWSGLFLRT